MIFTHTIWGHHTTLRIFINAHHLMYHCSDLYIVCILIFNAVANISFDTTEEQLTAVLAEIGPVTSVK